MWEIQKQVMRAQRTICNCNDWEVEEGKSTFHIKGRTLYQFLLTLSVSRKQQDRTDGLWHPLHLPGIWFVQIDSHSLPLRGSSPQIHH